MYYRKDTAAGRQTLREADSQGIKKINKKKEKVNSL